jgi:hypothetical protein
VLLAGDSGVGTLRTGRIVSALHTASSHERVDIVDDESHVLGILRHQ